LRVGTSGQIGIGGANYGNDGQVLTSTGAGSAPAWENAGGGSLDALTDCTVSAAIPTVTTNPSTGVGHVWIEEDTGNVWVCTDATTNANVWSNVAEGTRGAVQPSYGADILIVAGGGGGGTDGGEGGGGGAGGMLTYSATQLTPSTQYTVTVGAAGPGATSYSDRTGNGGDSSVTGLTTAVGGGLGGNYPNASPGGDGNNGGSGGGGGGNYSSGSHLPHAGGNGTTGQGYEGADGYIDTLYLGGGGGGKGAAGNQGSGSTGGVGGVGAASSITGASVYYAGGGGGNSNGGPDASGGNGGGGANGSNGTVNTGGGGGAKGYNGGSGVVIIRVLTSDYTSTTTGSPNVTTDGSYKVIKFTGSGSYTA